MKWYSKLATSEKEKYLLFRKDRCSLPPKHAYRDLRSLTAFCLCASPRFEPGVMNYSFKNFGDLLVSSWCRMGNGSSFGSRTRIPCIMVVSPPPEEANGLDLGTSLIIVKVAPSFNQVYAARSGKDSENPQPVRQVNKSNLRRCLLRPAKGTICPRHLRPGLGHHHSDSYWEGFADGTQ